MAEVVIETGDRYTHKTHNWLRVGLIGAALGVLVVVLSGLVERYIVDPLLCRGDALESCMQSGVLAANIAAVVVAMIGCVVLIRLTVHRPLAVVIAGLVTLWGVAALIQGLRLAEMFAWMAVLYALAYLLFANIFRIRSLIVAVVAAVAAMLLFRWVAFL